MPRTRVVRCARIAQAFLEVERRETDDWCLRQEYLCEFAATADQVFACSLVIGAISDNMAMLFPVVDAGRSDGTCPTLY